MNAKKLKSLIKKNPEPARGRFGINPMDPWSAKYGIAEATDKKDQVILNIPLLIRVLELAREDIKTDMDLHRVVEKLINIRKKGVLTMKDYNTIAHIKENHIAIAMGRMLDDEGSMILDQLDQLQRACNMIRTYVGKDTTKQLPAWVQSKITLATDYVDTAGNYLSSKNEKVTEDTMKCKDYKLHETKSCGCYKEEMVNEVSKKKLYDYMMKAGSKSDPKKDTKDRGMNVLKATGKYLNKEEVEHKVGDKVTVNSKFTGKHKGQVVKVDKQSVHVKRDGKGYSEKFPHDAVMKEEVLDELNYDTVDSYNSKRKANPSSKKSSEVTTKNKLTTNDRLFGKKPTQNSPMQGVKRELSPQQKTLQKDYHDSQKRGMSTEEVVNELSNELLGSYKKKAGEQASAADKAGDFKKGNKRFSGIVRATKKQFANDVKEETLDELNKDTLKSYLNKSTEIRKDSKSELKDIEKRPEMYKDNSDRAQQNIATRANKLKTTITKRTTGLNRAFNKLHGVAEAVDKKEMTKSARMIKALYKKKNVKEETYDWEKEDKSVQTYGKKPKVQMTDKKDSYGEEKPKAAITMTGGTTLTGEKRDDVEIDPMMKKRAGPANTFPGSYGKNS